MRLLTPVLVLLVVPSVAAAKTVVVDGFKVKAMRWNDATATVMAQASFDLNCPKEQLTMTLVAAEAKIPDAIGVRGCDQQTKYVRLAPFYNKWAMNTTTTTVPPSASEPAPAPDPMPPSEPAVPQE
jgi:hypothetical protein